MGGGVDADKSSVQVAALFATFQLCSLIASEPWPVLGIDDGRPRELT
jgi:hypothetical protein